MELHTELTIGEYFERKVAERGDADFIVFPDRGLRWSWNQFDERVDNLAKGLLAIGMEPGDHLGIWARNVPDWLTIAFATAKIGVVLVTVNPVYKSHELAYVIKQSDMKALAIIDTFRDVDYVEIVRGLVPEAATQERGRLYSAEFPKLKTLIYMGPEKHRGFYNVPELLVLGEHVPDGSARVGEGGALRTPTPSTCSTRRGRRAFPRASCSRTATSSTTASTSASARSSVPTTASACRCRSSTASASCWASSRSLTHGSTAVMVESFDPVIVLAAIQKERATALYGVPTMFIAELAHPMFDLFDLTSLRTGIMAGSPCPIETMRQVIDKMHASEMTICYGLTEASPVFTQTTTDDTLERKCETVGRKHDEVEVRVVDPETGEDCPPNVPGELLCRGYNIMKGYYNMPEATANAVDADGWLHSGDIGTVDEDGYYRITGRIKDMIIRGGENIYPREIEEFLYTMPGVEDAQVVGVPDPKYGEVVGAFIRLKAGAEMTEGDVQEFCRARMARYKAPKYVFFVDEYPMTASGKIQKYKLREMAAEKLGLSDVNVFASEA